MDDRGLGYYKLGYVAAPPAAASPGHHNVIVVAQSSAAPCPWTLCTALEACVFTVGCFFAAGFSVEFFLCNRDYDTCQDLGIGGYSAQTTAAVIAGINALCAAAFRAHRAKGWPLSSCVFTGDVSSWELHAPRPQRQLQQGSE